MSIKLSNPIDTLKNPFLSGNGFFKVYIIILEYLPDSSERDLQEMIQKIISVLPKKNSSF